MAAPLVTRLSEDASIALTIKSYFSTHPSPAHTRDFSIHFPLSRCKFKSAQTASKADQWLLLIGALQHNPPLSCQHSTHSNVFTFFTFRFSTSAGSSAHGWSVSTKEYSVLVPTMPLTCGKNWPLLVCLNVVNELLVFLVSHSL